MVIRSTIFLSCLVSLLCARVCVAQEIPDYKIGDRATNDVVTPVPLMVPDPVATALLKEKAQQEIRFIVRYAPSIADEAERAFRSHMALLRDEFVRDLTAAYGVSKVDRSVERTPKFLELTGRFRDEHKGTPKLFLYMPYWAQGRSDEHLLADWIGYIRRTMDRPVRPDKLPSVEIGTDVCLVTVPDLNVEVQPEHAERYGVVTPLDKLIPLAQAKVEMAAEFPEDDAYIAKFLGPFLKPNCVFDEALTREARQSRVESLVVSANYVAGEKIVIAGQVIDAKAVAALKVLREQSPEPPLNSDTNSAAIREGRDWVWMVIAGTAGGLFVLIGSLLFIRRKPAMQSTEMANTMARNRPAGPLLPARDQTPAELVSGGETPNEGESERMWRERAIAAERRAEQAKELARDKVTTALKDRVVERLSTHRNELIEEQLSAAEHMVGMEARLERIQGPIGERLKAYEARITKLEEELAVKDQENRALIQTKLDNIRAQIARAKKARSFDWN